MSDTTHPGLALMRVAFPPHQISKLPKPTKAQTEEVKRDFKVGIRCIDCGAWHHPKVIHLDYVGHAALTDRLLDADPAWSWEPLSLSDAGLPMLDGFGGMWIKLTICGITRLGYGHAGEKSGGDAIKEVIGDALRNAAMRFGAALELWHKGKLHSDDDDSSWLDEQKALILGAKTVGEMKAAHKAALAVAAGKNDAEAMAKLNQWATEKAGTAEKAAS